VPCVSHMLISDTIYITCMHIRQKGFVRMQERCLTKFLIDRNTHGGCHLLLALLIEAVRKGRSYDKRQGLSEKGRLGLNIN
jgi:hypothetical protein